MSGFNWRRAGPIGPLVRQLFPDQVRTSKSCESLISFNPKV
jgi:hypothetical protein